MDPGFLIRLNWLFCSPQERGLAVLRAGFGWITICHNYKWVMIAGCWVPLARGRPTRIMSTSLLEKEDLEKSQGGQCQCGLKRPQNVSFAAVKRAALLAREFLFTFQPGSKLGKYKVNCASVFTARLTTPRPYALIQLLPSHFSSSVIPGQKIWNGRYFWA